MEMPTPCQHCREIFDLNDGFGSEKWYPNTVICEECYRKEETEIEEDERLYDLNVEVSNDLFEVKWNELNKENQNTIKQLRGENSHYESLLDCCNQILDAVDVKTTPVRSIMGLRILLDRPGK